jgi:hypothetical protein
MPPVVPIKRVYRKGILTMKRNTWMLAALPALVFAGVALAQYPIMDRVADRVVQKYQSATCEQLWQEKAAARGKPKPPEEQRAIEFLRQDAAMRAAFFNRISAPIVNKMFECGMIP